MTAPLPRTPFTDEQRRKAELLSRCTFLPASWDKRYARDIWALAQDADGGLTEKQAALLERMYWRYRRQISAMPGDLPPFVEPTKVEKPPSPDALSRLDEWVNAVTPRTKLDDEQMRLL